MRVNQLLVIALAFVLLGMALVSLPDGPVSALLASALCVVTIAILRYFAQDKSFVTNVFLLALLARLVFGLAVHLFDLREFFGGDANTYDFRGNLMAEYWFGHLTMNEPEVRISYSGAGWGMNYLVGALYALIGQNILAAQSFCAVFGAAVAPMTYFCARKIFDNVPVAKLSAYSVALFPSFIIWSGQLLKDGLIVFLLVLTMTMVLQLHQRLDYRAIAILFISIAGILSLRFYIFYMVGIAVVGSFLVGSSNPTRSMFRRVTALVVLGLAVTYLGVTRTATSDFDRYVNLQQLQSSRQDLTRSASSGFGEDVDVSTTQGAISTIPIGFTYLMLAPFPWQMASLRQAITLPEVLVWWAMIPVIIYGTWWTIRHKLRSAFPILIFSLMLTLAYSIFQGNVGTAYRQRTQIQVFLFMFAAVGWQVYRERKEDKRLMQKAARMREMAVGGRG